MDKNILKKYADIESEFFDIDHERKIGYIKLKFGKPSDLMDVNCISKLPVFSDEFTSWLTSSMKFIPRKYKLDIDLEFEDMEGYTSERLDEIFHKNVVLAFKNSRKDSKFRNHIAVALIIAGLVFLVGMLVGQQFWIGEGFWRKGFFYLLDIATTVIFWEAATILLVESQERRLRYRNYLMRFGRIRFLQAEK